MGIKVEMECRISPIKFYENEDCVYYLNIDECNINLRDNQIVIVPTKHHITKLTTPWCDECIKDNKKERSTHFLHMSKDARMQLCVRHYCIHERTTNPRAHLCPKCSEGILIDNDFTEDCPLCKFSQKTYRAYP